MTRYNIRLFSVLAFALGIAQGCAGDPASDTNADPGEADTSTNVSSSMEDLTLIAEVPLEDGTLQYRETSSGAVIEIEKGDVAHWRERLPGEAQMSFAAKYTALTGKPAPQRLVELADETEGEADNAAPSDDASSEATPEADSGESTASVEKSAPLARSDKTLSEFINAYCVPTNNFWAQYLTQSPTRHKTSKAKYYAWALRSDIGSVTWDFLFEGTWWSGVLNAGQYVALTYAGNTILGRDAESKGTQLYYPYTPGLITHCVNSR